MKEKIMAKKLTADTVACIKKAFLDYPNLKVSPVAKRLKVSYDTVWDIIRGRYWKNVIPYDKDVCPYCMTPIETIKAHCTVVDNYYIDEETREIICSGGGEDPNTYEYWCEYCGEDLTPYIFNGIYTPKGGDIK